MTATDPSGAFDEIGVQIEVTNVQEKPSIAPGPTNITQTEFTTENALVATTTREGTPEPSQLVAGNTAIILANFSVTDHEDSDATLLKWSLSGSHADVIVICDEDELNQEECGTEGITGSDTGASAVELRLTELPDYEDPPTRNRTFSAKLTVTDRTRPTALTDSIDVTIKLINVDEPGVVTFTHVQPEVGTSITAKLTDPDQTSGGTVRWRWSADDGEEVEGSRGGSAQFTPLNSTSTTPPRVDLRKRLSVVATYTDGHGSGKTATESVRDEVQDKDDANRAPVFKRGGTTTTRVELTFAENEIPTNLRLASLITVDDDDDATNDLIFTLGTSGDNRLFTIGTPTSQEITLGEGTTFNFDSSKKSYSLDLRVTDPSGDFDDLDVIVNITDVQEAPRQPEAGLTVSYPEIKNSVPNTDSVHTYTTTDDDDRRISGSRRLTWRISGDIDSTNNTHREFFSITEGGVLSFEDPA